MTVQILDEFARGAAIPRDALEDVRAHVMAERDRRRADMLERLRRVNTAKLNRRLEEVVDHDSRRDARASGEARWWPGWGFAPSGCAPPFTRRGQMYAAEQLHVVRIATKKLRYALELVADARLAPVRPLLGTLKRAQETLGRLHDLQVIEQHVAAVQALPPGAARCARWRAGGDRAERSRTSAGTCTAATSSRCRRCSNCVDTCRHGRRAAADAGRRRR